MEISPLAEKPAEQHIRVNIPRLITAYYAGIPNTHISSQQVAFGTFGHRGLSLKNSFNENHILASKQVIYFYRKEQKIDGLLHVLPEQKIFIKFILKVF